MDEKETKIIYDFIQWSEKMEPKYELNAVDIEDVVRRHLNRVHRWARKAVNDFDKMPHAEVPKKYRTADWLFNKLMGKED